jgi:hypothetical protein
LKKIRQFPSPRYHFSSDDGLPSWIDSSAKSLERNRMRLAGRNPKCGATNGPDVRRRRTAGLLGQIFAAVARLRTNAQILNTGAENRFVAVPNFCTRFVRVHRIGILSSLPHFEIPRNAVSRLLSSAAAGRTRPFAEKRLRSRLFTVESCGCGAGKQPRLQECAKLASGANRQG